MNKKTQKELGEDLCEYCMLDEDSRGVKCYGGEPIFCFESCHCKTAYKIYLESEDE